MMEWLQVSVNVEAETAEAVADVLSRYAPGGVAIDVGGEEAHVTQALVTVKAYLPIGPDTPQVQRQIEEALWHLSQIAPIPAPAFDVVAEADWADAWKVHYSPLRIGRRIVIKPTWREFQAAADDIIIELDPGMAFGTGLHPTTQMCLQALEETICHGMRVLDLGTGTGILALAAAKLGAAQVLAVDTDPVAVTAAQENARHNGVADKVTIALGSLDLVQDSYDLVLVNILAKAIIALTQEGLAGRVKPEGKWVAAGIIESQLPEVVAALDAAGLRVTEQKQMADWVTLIGQKR